jgi:hypothetical protein
MRRRLQTVQQDIGARYRHFRLRNAYAFLKRFSTAPKINRITSWPRAVAQFGVAAAYVRSRSPATPDEVPRTGRLRGAVDSKTLTERRVEAEVRSRPKGRREARGEMEGARESEMIDSPKGSDELRTRSPAALQRRSSQQLKRIGALPHPPKLALPLRSRRAPVRCSEAGREPLRLGDQLPRDRPRLPPA